MLKRIERWGRAALVHALSWLLARRQRAVTLPEKPRILVIRLDERLGNLLLLTPLLSSLRARFPRATIELLANSHAAQLFAEHAAIDSVILFSKRAIFSAHGPLRLPFRLRRRRYDLCIDAANPTDPSTTQTIIARLSGATHTVGVNRPGFGRLYSAPVSSTAQTHEIDLRLHLLSVVPGEVLVRETSVGKMPGWRGLRELRARLPRREFAVLNVGARLANKMLSPDDYAELARTLDRNNLPCVITWGPQEYALAQATQALAPRAILAPPSDVRILAQLMGAAECVISCDTGPMHLAVALKTPTCGLFVSTDAQRFGYAESPHCAIDLRAKALAPELARVQHWLSQSV